MELEGYNLRDPDCIEGYCLYWGSVAGYASETRHVLLWNTSSGSFTAWRDDESIEEIPLDECIRKFGLEQKSIPKAAAYVSSGFESVSGDWSVFWGKSDKSTICIPTDDELPTAEAVAMARAILELAGER